MSENANEVIEKTVSEGTPSPALARDMGQGEDSACPLMYFVGDRVMHEDGHIGVVVNSGYAHLEDPDYGKKFLVRPERQREFWAKDDLNKVYAPAINQTIQKVDGTRASLAGFVEGGVMVWPYREEKDETWALNDFMGLADEMIRQAALDEIQQAVDQVAREKDNLQQEYDQLEDDYEMLAKAIPLPRRQVKTKMLVRSTVLNGETSSKAFNEMTTGELDTYLNTGWEILVKDTHTVYNHSSEKVELVQVFILRWDGLSGEGVKPDAPKKEAPPSKLPPVTPIQASKIFFEGDDEDEAVPDDVPESDPAAQHEGRAFAEILRDPDRTIDEIKSLGNLIALERGRWVFEKGQYMRRPPVRALPFG